MIDSLFNSVSCQICEGKLNFSYDDTLNCHKDSTDLVTLTIFEKIDSIMDKYFVFVCQRCGSNYKYTYKDIEKVVRKSIFKKLLRALIHDQIVLLSAHKDIVLIYCGKCTGYDGKGSCPRSMFVKCEIKKFPMEPYVI